jgi:hypothetical protein
MQITNLKNFMIYHLQKNPPAYTEDEEDKGNKQGGVVGI